MIGAIALASSASADIVYSGSMSLKVIDGDGGVGDPGHPGQVEAAVMATGGHLCAISAPAGLLT